MNERLESLMYLAGLTAQGCWDEMDAYDRQAIEKFAKLIVRECANIVNSLEQYEGQGDCSTAEYIKEHFGVE